MHPTWRWFVLGVTGLLFTYVFVEVAIFRPGPYGLRFMVILCVACLAVRICRGVWRTG